MFNSMSSVVLVFIGEEWSELDRLAKPDATI